MVVLLYWRLSDIPENCAMVDVVLDLSLQLLATCTAHCFTVCGSTSDSHCFPPRLTFFFTEKCSLGDDGSGRVDVQS